MPRRFGGGDAQIGQLPSLRRVFVVVGASDAAGRGFSTSLPAELQSPPQSGIDQTIRTETGDYDWRFLQPRLIPNSPTPRHGLEITFGQSQALPLLAINVRPAIVTVSFGSTSLAEWVAVGGELEDAIAFLQAQVLTLPGAGTIEYGGLIQFIGGQDAMSAIDTAAFYNNDVGLIATVRAAVATPDLPVILIRPSINLEFAGVPPPFLAEMRAALADVAADVPGAIMVSTDTYPLQADGTHLTSAGQQDLGIAVSATLPP